MKQLDDQKSEATAISVAVTATSTALSAIPDDTASPIADELADLSMPLFLIVSLLYIEKFMLTTFGWVSATILLPGACLLTCIRMYCHSKSITLWIKRLLLISAALIFVVPASMKITSLVRETYAETVSVSLDNAFNTAEDEEHEDDDKNAIVAFFSDLVDDASAMVEAAKTMLTIFTDAIAILLITNCLIPIATMFVFFLVIRSLMGTNISVQQFGGMVSNIGKSNRQKRKLNP